MYIIHIALGGCLKAAPVQYGLTADTGGHIAYVLDAASGQAESAQVDRVEIFTRRFRDPVLGDIHDQAAETVAPGLTIRRIATRSPAYLSKEALAAEVPDFADAFCCHLAEEGVIPDVIHAHFADAAAVAEEARRRFGVPFVYTPHSLALQKPGADRDPDLAGRIAQETRAIAAADRIVVSTHEEAEHQVGAYGVTGTAAKTVVLSPGVPREADGPTVAGTEDPLAGLDAPDRPIVLSVARPVAKKNLSALLRAYAGCEGLRERANLVILAGQDTPNRSPEEAMVVDELRGLVRDAGLQGQVALPPRHDPATVRALYRRAAGGGVFVNPALHEPFGLTVIEAAAAGVPVVATQRGGPAEIVRRIGHGVLVDPTDAAAIAAACLGIVGDRRVHDRYARAGRRGSRVYDWTRYAQGSVDAYRAAAPDPRLLVCDIDNTLTGCRDGARRFADWHRSARLPFAVATGRNLDEARGLIRDWGLPDPDAYLTDVGTAIYRPGVGDWSLCDDYHGVLLKGWDPDGIARAARDLSLTPQPDRYRTSVKLSYFGTRAEADRARRTLDAQGLSARVVHSHDRMIDILPTAGGKARAVHAYAASRGLNLAQCIAAGDSGNDEDMLNACGRAIVVANASDELAGLKSRAGVRRTRAAHANGVLEALGALGLCDGGDRAGPVP